MPGFDFPRRDDQPRRRTVGTVAIVDSRYRARNYRNSFDLRHEIGRSCLFKNGHDFRSLRYPPRLPRKSPDGSLSTSRKSVNLIAILQCEPAPMPNFRRFLLTIASICVASSLSGCVTSISCRKSCDTPGQGCPQTYEAIPQGIEPAEAPLIEPPPAPVPPAPASASRGWGAKTTSTLREMGDSVRDTFTR